MLKYRRSCNEDVGAKIFTVDTLYVCPWGHCCGIRSTELAYQQSAVSTGTSESPTTYIYCENVRIWCEKYGQQQQTRLEREEVIREISVTLLLGLLSVKCILSRMFFSCPVSDAYSGFLSRRFRDSAR